jgi:dihydrofolate reductase
MPSIALIAAFTENRVLGKDNQLIWHLPKDMRFFKTKTMGYPVIMGRKTFESFGKPLPGRTNIIITRNPDYHAEGTIVVLSLDDAIAEAKKHTSDTIFIAGGSEIYHMALPVADTMYLTHIHTQLDGDAFFPQFPESEWHVTEKEHSPADEKHAYSFDFVTWKRLNRQ